jgi:type II secretory pathway component GspD/PulD (secretin)
MLGIAAVLVLGSAICCQAAMLQNAATSEGKSTPTAPLQAPATASQAATKTMLFRFEDAAVEDVLREVTVRLGIVIEKDGIVPGRISIMVPEALNEDQAVALLDTILLSVRYAAVEVHYPGDERRILRVMTFEKAKKKAAVGE